MNAGQTLRLLAAAALLATACSSAGGARPAPETTRVPSTTSPPVTTSVTTGTKTHPPSVEEYRPGLDARLFLPDTGGDAPLVVMVPGGGWRTADPSGLAGLAQRLADAGMIALTVEIGAAEDGAIYPAPIEDIHCAVGFGLARSEEAGIDPGPVVVLGHSSGAHLAALAALTSDDQLPECTHPTVTADALIGLAGVYDVTRLPAVAFLLFGVSPDEDPGIWEEGNPLRRADLRPELPVLLLHGSSDPLVPVSFSDDFAAALTEGAHETTVLVVEGADHREIFLPRFTGDLIIDWIERLAEDRE